MTDRDWSEARRIGDALVGRINIEVANVIVGKAESLDVLAGTMLAFLALMKTLPDSKPPALERAIHAVDACLSDMTGTPLRLSKIVTGRDVV